MLIVIARQGINVQILDCLQRSSIRISIFNNSLGETCSHAAAILFKVEAAVRIGLNKSACTSEACRWNRVFGNNSLTAPIEEINFKPAPLKKKDTEPRAPCPKTTRQPLACTVGDEGYMEAYFGYLEKLKVICPNACVFKSLPRLDPEETDTASSQTSSQDELSGTYEEEQDSDFQVVINCSEERAIRHPTTPIDTPGYPLMGIEFEKCTSVPIDTSEKCVNYSTLLHVTYQESNQLQCETQKQSECPKWYALKYPRLTASKFGDICKKMEISRAKPKLLADKLLQQNPPTTFVDRMLKWGRENEDVAVQVYRGLGDYKMVKIFPCGFYISPEDSFLGATPDRVVYDPLARHPWGILEVKCPYSVKKKTAIQAAKEVKTFMCREENGLLFLKESDPYYYQVQGQMGITGAKWCDFIVYTTQGISVQRIEYDSDFWKAEAKKLGEFYFSHFLPKYIMLQVSV